MNDTNETVPERMGYGEAARFLGIATGTLYLWVFQKKIPHLRFGPRLVRFSRTELEAWMRARRVPCNADARNSSAS